tara:strand:- start:4993 stop:5115 length:123 start_codon:yes stop_codon:yes gene_type:complete
MTKEIHRMKIEKVMSKYLAKIVTKKIPHFKRCGIYLLIIV